MAVRPTLALCAVALLGVVMGDLCPDSKSCPEACCPSNAPGQYFCCPRSADQDRVYMVGLGPFWKDYWWLFLTLFILGLIISIVCSVLCCLYCNGCWWHRRRNPDIYSGCYCWPCGRGLPLGTLIYSPYVGPPPNPHHPPSYYDDSPDSSVRSAGGRKGVRFDQDTMVKSYDNAPKSVLKKPNGNGPGGRNSPNLLL